MNSASPASKHRYDITMSRRTRKQLARSEQGEARKKDNGNNSNGNGNGVVCLESLLGVKEGDDEINEHKSLKQLINGDHHHRDEKKDINSSNQGRSSLGQHFNEEEKSLQVVRRSNQNESVQEGLKLKTLVRRYAKVLGRHLMKPNRDPHLPDAPNKPLFKLSK